ncbi:hypothetical protein AKJ57_05050 [candidate division MSBL1 archaeon SCGC-AAA259A05]|uniref:Type-4 uracil-DNA glycosylase n=1 Tax=candidate division MSBL1 archaeon SCGC-AAA259A05 TaxID=1698259 RepID=A0A133U629_9EURY|nr:hypothetical protein AKJ57_05050 [candidate division MSBL1 archaeon SCGC-AAA259A05]
MCRMKNLDELTDQIKRCTSCDLHKTHTNAVPGEGPKNADIMLIGEAPGYYEDQEGRPFVGNAGEVLTNLLEKAGLKREKVFIGNVLKCRPPKNRDPTEEEIKACSPYLKNQIRKIRPKLIVSLGRFATQLLLDQQVKISQEHGELKNSDYGGWSCKLFVSYHPAAALYGGNARKKLEKDFEKLGNLAKNLDNYKTSQQMTF